MPYPERDGTPIEGDRQIRHQASESSDLGFRGIVPMWDSSDPDRAPPPLPLNPQSPGSSFSSRAGTSSAIQSAHAALSERARESAFVPALTKRHDASPERGLIKSGSHRRMQSLQPGTVRDIGYMIEGPAPIHASPTRSPEKESRRPSTPNLAFSREGTFDMISNDNESTRSTPTPGPSLTPIVRPTAVRRPPPQSILGENTPPQSSTMLALQNMSSHSSLRDVEPPLSIITNGSPAPGQKLPGLDHLSSQIISLTSIATALQKEMSKLSRRSRDNATDLLSLKEATNTRDEDIRKSLRDLLGNVNEQSNRLAAREHSGALFLDNKPYCISPPNGRSFQLPRIPSPKSFAESIDGASVSTPSLAGGEGAATSFALLEKIFQGLGTKDGQETLLGRLTELSEKLGGMATSAKVEELADYVRASSETAIVQHGSDNRELENQRPTSGPMTQRVENLLRNTDRNSGSPSGRGAELLNDDLINIIRSVKDSVAQGGGLTAEVKALVRELRGEVLGMGRELGKRLEHIGPRDVEETDSASKDDVSRVIDEGLEQMKEQLNNVLREHRRQSAASASSQKTLVDYQEIYNAMRAALRDNESSRSDMPDLSRDDVIEAVREAWETYKPEIEVQQLGLERDEVLACLQEGLQEYAPRDEKPAGATREEVFKAVVEGLKHFVPPQVDTTASLSRDEIIEAVRDCLEEFEFPVAASAIGNDMTHQDMVHAVREGLNDLDLPRSDAMVVPADNQEIFSRLEDILGYMKLEFRAVSEEAKENVAATGRDTEQVLDATKDGLENLRIAIESYVDRASNVAGQEEFMDGMQRNLEDFKDELARLVVEAAEAPRVQLQAELEGLREIVNSSMVPVAAHANNQEVLEALQNGVNNLRQEFHRPRTETGEILDALHEGLNEIRAGIDRVSNKPVDLTANDEILEALKSGLDSVRSDIEMLRDNSNDRAVTAVRNITDEDSIIDNAVVPADTLKHDDIKNLEVLITQLRIKVEAMEPETESVQKDDLTRLEDMLRSVQQGVDVISSREPAAKEASDVSDVPTTNGDAASRDDVQAIETILRNTKTRLDDLIDGEQAVRKEHIDVVEGLILETRESMAALSVQMEAISQKDDMTALESLLGQVALGLDEVKERTEKDLEDPEKITKADIEAVETVVLEIKTALDGLSGMEFANISNKEDIVNLETIVKEAKEKLDAYAETSTQALDDRQAEIVGVGERVSEVKTFLEEFQDAIKAKLDDGSTGVEALGTLLEAMGEKIDKNENVGPDLKEMFDTMKAEFEESKEIIAGAKLESDEKLQQVADNLGVKIEDKIGELITKYDDFQAVLDEKSQVTEARDLEAEAAIVGTKAVADELKLLIDTLGCTVTDSLEKMEEASKTVFSKVEDLALRTEDSHSDGKSEHQQTREQIQQMLSTVEDLRGNITDHQPQILEAVKDILLLVGQHYEHSKTSTTDIQDKMFETRAAPDQAMLMPPEKYDDSEVREKLNRLVEQKYDDSQLRERLEQIADHRYDDSSVHEKLDRLADHRYDDSHVQEKLDMLADHRYDDSHVHEKLDRLVEHQYDDSNVHEKLDRLVDHTATAEQSFDRLETLDKVHASVVNTAAEISSFLSSQTQRITDEHDDREKTLQETIASLERKLAEKEHVETTIMSLKDEEDRIRNSVTTLRTEQESLIRQKTRLTGDVSSLETALRLRKEELFDMEGRAESLERRIIEGVMDHSRVLLMAKTTKSRDNMNRKRVKKPAADESELSKPRSTAVNMALSAKRNLGSPAQNGTARRIASLSHMNNNSVSALVKRSQSVRSPAGGVSNAHRKRSWGGALGKSFGEDDKENASLREMTEELEEPRSTPVRRDYTDENSMILESVDGGEDDHSDTDTLRRSSRGTVITTSTDPYTESDVGYSEYDDDAGSEWTESVVGAASSVGTDRVEEDGLVVYGQ